MKKRTHITRRQLLTAGAAAAGAALLPGGFVSALASIGVQPATGNLQDPIVDAVKGAARREKISWKVEPFPMAQVRLRPGIFQNMQEINRRYIAMIPNERLLHSFRVTAGHQSSAEPLGGWEAPDVELRGHLAGGHYLSASAFMYASTGDEDVKKKADALVTELARCQEANGSGYLSAFPPELFDRLKAGTTHVWAPFYTIHKIMAGHLDMWTHCDNDQALQTVENMAGWVDDYLRPVGDDQWAHMQLVEHGGMNETLFNLYSVTGKEKYLALARRFDHKKFFDPLSERRDELKGLHTNTNIPKVIGAAHGYELTGDDRYHTIADYFWHEVVGQRSYATGGTSNGEGWYFDAGDMSKQLGTSAEECCCSYNMMKLSRHLFGWTADAKYMDYYERLLFNVRLGTQDPDGMLMYYVSLAPRGWKTFGTTYDAMWCCTGSGIEEYSKLNDTIYFHDASSIYVNQFIASEVSWPEKGLKLVQDTTFPESDAMTLTVQAKNPTQLSLRVRVPYWATRGAHVKVNGAAQTVAAAPGSYLTLNRMWKTGDKVEFSMPMTLHAAPLIGAPTLQAAMYGPLVLAGRFGNEGLTREMIYGQLGPRMRPGGPSPEVQSGGKGVDWVEPAGNGKLSFRLAGQKDATPLVPMHQILGERYNVYWKVNSKTT
ncbi:MAG: glycoside hydrolase family 127 protein [Candidatus Acidiferrales bacterium]